MNLRKITYDILREIIIQHKYSNLVLKNALIKVPLINRAFISELTHGVLRNYFYLKAQFKIHVKSQIDKKHQIILMMAYYEKQFLKAKDYYIVNEYVKLAKNKSLINAILRNHLNEINNNLSEEEKTNLPNFIYQLVKKQNDEDFLKEYLKSINTKPIIYYHLNPNLCTKDKLLKLIPEINFISHNIFTANSSLIDNEFFKMGYFYIQDYSASKIADFLSYRPNSLILDACCAPGSKLFNILEKHDQSLVYGLDNSETRLELVKKKADILGYKNLNLINHDARKLSELDLEFDEILLDVPCSGLGVLARKLDLKFNLKPENLDELIKIQAEILDSAYEVLKKDGFIIYATCTINKKENEQQIIKFINKYKDIEKIQETYLHESSGDFFYVCKLRKKG